jgi:DegV family protein with EDD domain
MDMKKIAITTDTNSGMIPHEQDDKGIFVLPMPFVVDGESLLDRVDLSLDDFYAKLIGGSKVSPSQPSAADVSEFWTEILKEYDEIVHIPTSSFLSAACSTAQALSAEFGGKVRVVDNHAISIALHTSVINAATLRDKGLSTEDIATTLESMTNDYSVYFSLHGMEYLKRGGRISAAAAAIGSILKLRPVLHLNDGKLEKFATPRTPVKAKEIMKAALADDLNNRFKEYYEKGEIGLIFAHAHNPEEVEEFKAEITKLYPQLPVLACDEISLSVACHTGPGTLGVGCMRLIK